VRQRGAAGRWQQRTNCQQPRPAHFPQPITCQLVTGPACLPVCNSHQTHCCFCCRPPVKLPEGPPALPQPRAGPAMPRPYLPCLSPHNQFTRLPNHYISLHAGALWTPANVLAGAPPPPTPAAPGQRPVRSSCQQAWLLCSTYGSCGLRSCRRGPSPCCQACPKSGPPLAPSRASSGEPARPPAAGVASHSCGWLLFQHSNCKLLVGM